MNFLTRSTPVLALSLALGVSLSLVAARADTPLAPLPTPPETPTSVLRPMPELLPFGVATLSVCNNRVNPANAAEMATQMLLGTPVEILGRERSYYQVRTPDGYVSWTDGAGVTPMDAATFARWQRAEKVVVTAEYAHAFSAASPTSTRVSDLVQGNILQLLEKRKGFYKVAFPDGRTAYLPLQDAQPYARWSAQKNPSPQQVIAVAKTLMGVPYLWGGTSVKGVDCSGLTKTSFFLNGIIIPRDASQQALVGTPVDIAESADPNMVSLDKCLKNLLPGDLLFFGSPRSPAPDGQPQTPRVTHTALYLGNGEFIQAAGLVRINSMVPGAANYSDFGRRKILSARRIIGAIGTPEITRVDQHPAYRAPK